MNRYLLSDFTEKQDASEKYKIKKRGIIIVKSNNQ